MKTIEQVQTQINELQKELENLKNPPSCYKRWRAKKGERFYYIQYIESSIMICPGTDDTHRFDDNRFKYGNYYKTEEEAEKARDKQLAIVRVNDRINELNEGWEHNNNQMKYYIFYGLDQYRIDCCMYSNYTFNLKYMKTKEIAEKIIDEMKDDLDLIFNI